MYLTFPSPLHEQLTSEEQFSWVFRIGKIEQNLHEYVQIFNSDTSKNRNTSQLFLQVSFVALRLCLF